MSQHNLENSVYSESNSFEGTNQTDASSSASDFSPVSSNKSRLNESYSSDLENTATNNNNHHSLFNSQTVSSSDLNSLPILTRTTQFNRADVDPELSSLLTRKQPRFIPQAPKCDKCNKSVYKAEEIRAANKTFHKLCFKCNNCNKLLEPSLITEHQGDLYCKNCYGKKFGPKGYGYGAGAGVLSTDAGSTSNTPSQSPAIQEASTLRSTFSTYSSSSFDQNENISPRGSISISRSIYESNLNGSNQNINDVVSPPSRYVTSAQINEKRVTPTGTTMKFGGSDKCAHCQKAVYAAEKVVAAGKSYHKLCFSCNSCKKLLSSMNCCDNSAGEIFCKSCYGKKFGPKGVGYGLGAGTLQTN